MLKRTPSLKVRAAAILVAIYAAILIIGFSLAATTSLSPESQRHHAGPQIALVFAARDLRQTESGLALATDGSFARLAARNPGLWLTVQYQEQRLTFGPVPDGLNEIGESGLAGLESARFHSAGEERPLADAVLERRGPGLYAAGGVDPSTVRPGEALQYFLADGLFVALSALGLLGLVALLLAVPFLTASLRPARRQVASIQPDNPIQRIDETRVPSEILPLVRGFNSALDRLAEELVRRRRFIADAAHELRTPLAVLTLQVDAAEDTPAKEDMRRVVTRLSNLVAQMLDVQRLSLGGRQHSFIDLEALAREVVGEMAPMALASGYDLALEAASARVMVEGDPHALGRAIGNLIGNAIAHGGGQGPIRVRIGEDRTLDVIDEGPGIPSSVREDLFEPFRRERWDRDGCGLGLHMTREIMRAHSGDAKLLPTESGAAFRLTF